MGRISLIEDVKSYLGADWDAVVGCIRGYLSTDIELLDRINSRIAENPGKQLRPVLVLLLAKAFSADKDTLGEDTVRIAAATEILHNATLLHDDVADKADNRRGVPTLRKQMGPSVSVLVGDFWLVRAVKAILDSSRDSKVMIEMFAGTLSDLAEGEMFQLQKASSRDTSFDDYLRIIYCKTASLFVVACRCAAITASASPEMMEAALQYGKYLGYAFQMRDDIFDYMPSADFGKPVGVDILEGKITLPLLGALSNVDERTQRGIRDRLSDLSEQTRDRVLDFVRANGGVEYAQRILEEYVNMARSALDPLPDCTSKEMLLDLAGYVAIRKK